MPEPLNSSAKVVILGATSAMAEATARLFAAEGASLVIVARDEARLTSIAADLSARGASKVETVARDLCAADDAFSALQGMVKQLGSLSHCLIFYGILGDQTKAETDWAQARAIIDTNFTSAAAWSLAAADILEKQQMGSLVVVGSVAGDRGRQSNFIYGSAKAGIGILVQGIAHRLALRGGRARAVLVKPGFVDTPMTDGLKKGGPLWAKPENVAQIIRKAADKGGPIVYAPWFWRFILLIIRLVPTPIFHKVPL